jgi:RNA polymerase sigma-70 factor (ECF subfamily)
LVFVLSRFESKTYKEIAEELDISIKTVENQIGYALKYLRNKIKNE